MSLYVQNYPTQPYDAIQAGVIIADIFGVAINWYVDRTPLLYHLPRLYTGAPTFTITNDNYRSRSVALSGSYSTSGTTLTFTDATEFEVGDVLLVESEYFLVTATHATTPTVTFAYAGSTNANHASGKIAQLITNTRTGAETLIGASSRTPVAVVQDCQTVQHAYRVGGSLASTTNYVSGLGTPLQRDKMIAMQHCFDDFESAMYRGVGISYGAGSGTRAMMKGLASLIVTNLVTSPTNAGAYKPSDFVRDVVQPAFDNGGNPSAIVVSTDFLTGLETWGMPAVRLEAGATEFGTKINVFEVPFLAGMTIIPAPLLPKGTAFALTTMEVRARIKRALFDKPRGSAGDAYEGDMIMEGAIELDNEAHHTYVSGITAFSAS